MSIPERCTVVVIGGGPAGSYAASVLARDGIDTVLLEADTFPRYHIGESLLPSIRYYLDFIDVYDKFNKHGFLRKNGATFKFNSRKPGYTDFVAAGGAGNHAWNVVRSEADEILFKHARTSGAKVFDEVKVENITFDAGPASTSDSTSTTLGRPVSASWKCKDTTTGEIRFDYLIDASGRAGVVSTRYMKNRVQNPRIRSMAVWGYWTGGETYGPGIGDPFSEAITDGSGWAWYIPLHDGTVSVGITMKQDQVAPKKKAWETNSTLAFYLRTLKDTPGISSLLSKGTLKTDAIRTTSDWSYSASTYSSPYLRIAGDAGCFIDPLFSSGVHLAMNSGLSAALTVCASIRGHCSEDAAAQWHSQKVAEGYTRFLLVVKSALDQIHGREDNILNEIEEPPGFNIAFEHFKPRTVDAGGKLSRAQISKSVNFCARVIEKVESGCLSAAHSCLDWETPGGDRGAAADNLNGESKFQKADEMMMKIVRLNRVVMMDDEFGSDVIDGMRGVVRRGGLGLVSVGAH